VKSRLVRKMIKRQMYGRATFGLLRKRVLLC
jgi:transposase